MILRMVRKGDWKLQADMMGSVYLYNLKEDPRELNDLADDPAHAAIKAELLTALTTVMLRACDPLPVPHHRYRLKRHPKGFWQDSAYHTQDMGVAKEPPLKEYWRD